MNESLPKPNYEMVAFVYECMFRDFLAEKDWQRAAEVHQELLKWKRRAALEKMMEDVSKPLEVPYGW